MKARIKAQFVFDVYVNGAYNRAYSTVNSVSATFKQAVQMAKKMAKKISADEIRVDMYANGLFVGYVAFNCGNYEIYDNGANPESRTPETTESDEVTTATTETAENVAIPEFDELSHGAMNIVLSADNTERIYMRFVEPLSRCLCKKHTRGLKLSVSVLAESSTLKSIIRESIKELNSCGFDGAVSTADRKQAALYLANAYISSATFEPQFLTATTATA